VKVVGRGLSECLISLRRLKNVVKVWIRIQARNFTVDLSAWWNEMSMFHTLDVLE